MEASHANSERETNRDRYAPNSFGVSVLSAHVQGEINGNICTDDPSHRHTLTDDTRIHRAIECNPVGLGLGLSGTPFVEEC
jgi:hypothetical protein